MSPEPTVSGGEAYSQPWQATEPVGKPWWYAFSDPELDTLIRTALEQNLDISQAIARLSQAKAIIKQASSTRLPSVDLDANFEKSWIDGEEQNPLTSAGAGLTWEIDLFNRLGAAAYARRSEQNAREADLAAVRLLISIEVASAYFDAVEQMNQLKLLNEQIEIDKKLLALTEMRFEAGLTASVDVLQQSSQLAETESLVPPAEAALRVSENRLDVLIGESPDALDRVSENDDFAKLSDLPFIGVPSDLLLNRPDLKALQFDLIASDALIGQAIAERLPRITLNGSILYVDRPQIDGMAVSVLGSLVQPLLDWGARKAEVERSRALYVERLAAFTKAYIEAIEDVENSLYQERKQRQFLDRLERNRLFLARTVEETKDRYTNGLTDFLPVLNAIKELQRLERVIVRQQRDLLGFRLQLHRALGSDVMSFLKSDMKEV